MKILDFGLAGLRQEAALEGTSAAAAGETPTRAFFGTPGYVAPERLQGEPPSPRGDVFSLGAVLYEMLSGGPPFNGATPTAVLTATGLTLLRSPTGDARSIPATRPATSATSASAGAAIMTSR